MNILAQGFFDDEKKNTTWTLDDSGRLVINGKGSTDFIWRNIPWKKYSEIITEVYFSRGLVWVSVDFEDFPNLKKVEFADSVKDFNGNFKNCPNLSEIIIPDSMVQITDRAFEGTPWFANQPDGMVYAGKVFYKYKGKFLGGEIRLKDGTTGIARGALRDCENITNIVIPESVASIGPSDFTFDYHNKQMRIGVNWALDYNECLYLMGGEMRDFKTPDEQPWRTNRRYIKTVSPAAIVSPNNIGSYAFAECTELETVSLSKNTKIISAGAFQNCKKLRKITGLDGIQIIEKGAFFGCENLTEFSVPKLIKGISGLDLVRYNESRDIVFDAPETLAAQNDPNTVVGGYGDGFTWMLDRGGTLTIIGEGELPGGERFNPSKGAKSFSAADETKRLVIDERITEIGYGVFKNFNRLAEVVLPPNLKHICSEAFRGCTSLKNIVFPKTLETISWHAFSECKSIEEIEIPENVSFIDYYAFSGCGRLRKFSLPENTILSEGVLEGTAIEEACPTDIFYFNEWALGLKNILKDNTVLKFKSGTRKISALAFGSPDYPINEEIAGVVLDGDITYIGEEAFRGCENLESVTANCTLTTIGSRAFGCTKWLADQPQGLIYLANALLGTKDAVNGYSKRDDKFDWESVVIDEFHGGRKITVIADYAFSREHTIKGIKLPESIESIGVRAFDDCEKLEKINLPNGLKTIGRRAFCGCVGLKDIYVPGTVEEIGDNALGFLEIHETFNWYMTKIEGFKIIGEKNSAAEKYAALNGIEFVAVC